MEIKRGSAEHRVLVELAGQARPMSLRELFDELGGVYTIDQLRRALWTAQHCVTTGYRDLPGGRKDYNVSTFAINWEGEQALREADESDTRRMRAVTTRMSWRDRLKRAWRL